MAQKFAVAFYHSKAWKEAREAYKRSVRGLCERCLDEGRFTPGIIVHHKVHLSPENINDTSITVGFDNLELVCRDCHAAEHPEIYGEKPREECRVAFDEYGNVVRMGIGQ